MPTEEDFSRVRQWFVRYAIIWSGFNRCMSIQFATNKEYSQHIPGNYLNEDGVSVVEADLSTDGIICTIEIDWKSMLPDEVITVPVPKWKGISFLPEEDEEGYSGLSDL